jgi:hypothetical protein
MKEFRKSDSGQFICEECHKNFKSKMALLIHVSKSHNGKEDYIKKWIKEDSDGLCKNCGNETSLHRSEYRDFCSVSCSANHKESQIIKKNTRSKKYKNGYFNVKKWKDTLIKKYGVDHPMKIEKSKIKTRKTKKENHDNENFNNREKATNTCLKKYGVKYPLQNKDIYNKFKDSILKSTGYNYPLSSEKAKIKFRQTCQYRYGVDYPSQDLTIFIKQQKSGMLIKEYRDTGIYYRGSYEFDFLKKYYDKFKIENPISVKYTFNNKNRIYHPDFYLPEFNLIVEIKNNFLYNKYYESIIEKEKSVVQNNFNFILILEKNYNEFNEYIKLF